MPKQNRDCRKKWYKNQQKMGVNKIEVYLHPTLQPGCIIAISLMDLKELLSIIKET